MMTSQFIGANILNWYSIYFTFLLILVALGVSPMEAKDSITSGRGQTIGWNKEDIVQLWTFKTGT